MKPSTIAAILAAGLLAACGGGGGNGVVRNPDLPSSPLSTSQDLTSLTASTTVPVGSVARMSTASGDYTPLVAFSNAPTLRVVIATLGIDDTYTQADLLSTTVIGGVQMPTLARASGGTSRRITYLLPASSGLSLRFSSLGIWDRADITTGVIFDTAAISFGNRTLGADIPTVGTATYSGFALGNAIEAGGQQFSVTALATATADFQARSVILATANSAKTNRATGALVADAGYNVTGALVYSAGVNALSGSVTSANGKTGTASGAFYGPQAAELGVTFQLASTGGTLPFVGGAALKKQ